MKVQGLSVKQRKVVLWVVVMVLGILLLFWWGRNVAETLQNVSLPKLPKEFQENVQRTQEEFIFSTFEEIEIPEEILQELQEYGQNQGQ